jgi:hypothetical protein
MQGFHVDFVMVTSSVVIGGQIEPVVPGCLRCSVRRHVTLACMQGQLMMS